MRSRAACVERLEYRRLLAFTYTWTDLGTFTGQDDVANWGLNDRGDVVGLHNSLTLGQPGQPPTGGGGHAWIDQTDPAEGYRNGFLDAEYSVGGATVREKRSVGVPTGQPAARVMDINDEGVVAGTVYVSSTRTDLALWDANTLVGSTSSAVMLGQTGSQAVSALVINNDRHVLDPFGQTLWRDGTRIDLRARLTSDTGGNASLVFAHDINEGGVLLISASSGGSINFFLWTPGLPPQDTGIRAGAIGALNDHGAAVLETPGATPGTLNTVLWSPGGGTVPVSEFALSPLDINNHGQVIGTRTAGGVSTPYVWDRAGLVNLNARLDRPDGVQVTHAMEINNFGQIVALGRQEGERRAYVLSPKLGLDRWWATAGTGSPLEVTWTVRAEGTRGQKQALTLDLDGIGGGWQWASGSVQVLSNGSAEARSESFGSFDSASVGPLEPGTYQFRMSFSVPADRGLDDIEFEFGDTTLDALFVSDHPEQSAGAVFPVVIDGVQRTYAGAAALVSAFAPVFHFESGDFDGPWDVQSTWGTATQAYDGNPSWTEGVPAGGHSGQTMNLSRFSANPSPNPRAGVQTAVPPTAATVYGTVLPSPSGSELAVTYFFHYPMSNWGDFTNANTHEGDWEGITVFLGPASGGHWQPTSVAYSIHVRAAGVTAGGVKVPWSSVLRDAPGTGTARPYVYVGLGGHASYPAPGQTEWTLGPRFPYANWSPNLERHRGGVRVSGVQAQYLPRVSEIAPDDDQWDWLLYPGHWGRLNQQGLTSLGDDGPLGPVFLSLGATAGARWLDPWSWAAGFPPAVDDDTTFSDPFDTLAPWQSFGDVQVVGDGTGANTVVRLTEASDAGIASTFPLQPDAQSLHFKYRFVAPGSGDVLRARLNGGTVLTVAPGTSADPALRGSASIDVSSFAGQSVQLELRLASAGAADAVVWIDDLSVTGNGPPRVAFAPPNSPRNVPLDQARVLFSERISGFDLGDLALGRDGGPNLLTSGQTLTSTDARTFTLGGLAGLTTSPGTYTLSVLGSGSGITDVGGEPLEQGASVSFVVDTAAPTVASAGLLYDALPHALRFTFSEDVGATLSAADLSIVDVTTGAALPQSAVTLAYDAASRTALFVPGALPGRRFADGRYRATLAAGSVADAAGNVLASSFSADFVFFPGDANNDGTVNLLDFNRLAANFGQSPRTFSQGDFNYDGVVNLLDFNVLASRFGTAIGTSNNLARIGAAGAPWAGNSDTRGGRGSPWEDNDDDSDELAQRSDER